MEPGHQRIPFDDNRKPFLTALSYLDGQTAVPLWADPVTGKLLVETSAQTSPTSILSGKTVVTTSGTRVSLASSTACKSVTVKALTTNTGIIYVGSNTVSSSNGLQLAASDSVSFDISDLNTINIDSSVNGEGVTYLGVN
jgi:hypothetical protein